MSRTVAIEQLPLAARRAFEELLSFNEPIVIARDGEPLGGMIAYGPHAHTVAEITPEEAADIQAAIAQGEADYVAGRYLTLEEFKTKYADRLREDERGFLICDV